MVQGPAHGIDAREKTVREWGYERGSLRTFGCKVCGTEVNLKSTPARSKYEGKIHLFCSPACKKAFDATQARYAGGGGHEMAGHGGHMM
ncbi:MAG: YHS domain-containing protein [Chloroflexi bacterium]|nr:YHS domain-containing protein [Chloroflexota bacterium]